MSKCIKILSVLILVPFFMFSQEENTASNPVVGVVLSGGGAKGLAHIGVLKEIEKAGIEVDYIGGTSMGAIIGALYASGYTATQLDSIFSTIDFNKLIQDDIPRGAKTLDEKKESDKYALTLPFENFSIELPSALSKGQNIYNLFAKLTEHVSEVEDFDNLPIPFFCIATDVEQGKEVVIDKGYLPNAIAASGALPSLFSPLLLDDKLLIDGGVVNNYPVEELRRRGAEFIIGVDVQDTLRTREELKSAPEILLQINNYRTIQAMDEKIKLTDVYIKPDISGFSVVDFELGKQIIDSGQVKAQLYKNQLDHLAQRQKKLKKPQPLQLNESDSLYIKSINIDGASYYTRSYVLGKLKLRPPTHITYEKLYEGINNLSATGNFDHINHRLEKYDDGGKHLALDLRESNNTMFLRAALHYDDLYKSGVLVNFTKKRLLFKNDNLSLDFVLGDNVRYELDYYSDNGFYIGFGLKSYYNSFEPRINARFIEQLVGFPLDNFNNVTVDYEDFTNQIYIQTLFEKQFALSLGAEHKLLIVETETVRQEGGADSKLFFEDSNYFSLFGNLHLDSMDSKYFPTQGWYFNGDFHLYLLSSELDENFEEFSIGKAELKYAKTIFPKFAMTIGTSGGFKLGETDVRSLDFFLGGWGNDFKNNMIPFLGYDYISAAGNGFVKADITFDYNFIPKNHIVAGANFANIENDLFKTGNWLSTPDYTGYHLGYGLETFLGPLQGKVSYSPELDETFWYFSIGFWF